MLRGRSRDASHGSRSAGAMRVPQALRLLYVLALAIVTVVCAGITSAGRIASLVTAFESAAPDSANAVRRASAPASSHQWRERAPRRVVELKAVEADSDDDDGDTLTDAADDSAVASRGVSSPRKPGRPFRDEPQSDTSRFVVGTGLPRGPPA